MKSHPQKAETNFTRPDSDVYFECSFYERTEALRSQFEESVRGQGGQSGGMTPLTYAFCENRYQFLTASAERLFDKEATYDLMNKLSHWGNSMLGVSHVSTPQIRVYINGCARKLVRDNVNASWHFVLSIARCQSRPRAAQIEILKERFLGKKDKHMSINKIVRSMLAFNQLLVHSTRDPYAIAGSASMNPLEASVLIDGYLW
jgi:hypothetical protein